MVSAPLITEKIFLLTGQSGVNAICELKAITASRILALSRGNYR